MHSPSNPHPQPAHPEPVKGPAHPEPVKGPAHPEPVEGPAHPEPVEGYQRTETPSGTLPTFTPVPRARPRSNGWKPEVQRTFIEALAETGSVKAAARRVGRAEVGAYLLRRHPEAGEFRRAWDAALDIGMRRIEDVAMERALNGVEVPVYAYGKIIGTRTVYNDRLLMFMLRNRASERFAGGRAKAMSAADKETLKKLKAQWREEWEREATEEDAAALDDLCDHLDTMAANREANLSPRARELYAAYEAQRAADRAIGAFGGMDLDDDEDEDGDDAHAEPTPTIIDADFEELPRPTPPEHPTPPNRRPGGPRIHTIKGEWE